MTFFYRFFKQPVVRYLIACGICLAVGLLYLFLHDFVTPLYYVDAFGIGGGVTFCIGMLILVTYFGQFDTISYTASKMSGKQKYADLVDYAEKRSEKNRKTGWSFAPFITVGIVSVAVSFILRFTII